MNTIDIGTAQVTPSAIYVKLSQKYAQLANEDKKIEKENLEKQKQDYIEVGTNNYDKNDYEKILDKLKSADSNIRSHEQAHAAAGTTTSPIQYNYQQGPDGKMYAVGGHVRLDTSIPDDPKAASAKLDEIKRSATASSDMSGADANISIQANLMKMKLQLQSEDTII